jgi:hypothetical protein
MSGFSSAAVTGDRSGTGTTGATTAAIAQANAQVGATLVVWVGTYVASGTPPAVSGVPSFANVTTATPVKIGEFTSGLLRSEMWAATVTGNASYDVTATVALDGTATLAHCYLLSMSGFPATWYVESLGTYGRGTNSSSHPCGEITTTADRLCLTGSMLSGSKGTATVATDYTGISKETSSYMQYRVTTGALTSDATWSGTNSRQVTSIQVVMAEGTGPTPPAPPARIYPRMTRRRLAGGIL